MSKETERELQRAKANDQNSEQRQAGIGNLDSFASNTGNGHEVAGLYFYSMLDCLIDLAYKVSYDFFKRPHLYTELEPPVTHGDNEPPLSQVLAELHARYGSDELFPSTSQRDEIYMPIFGRAAGYSTTESGDFPRLRDELISAAAAFAERVFSTGEQMLRERVKTTLVPFREYLSGLNGDSIKWSRGFALARLTEKVSYRILRSTGVSGVFGIVQPPKTDWPYAVDPNGEKLVEAISKQLIWTDKPEESLITRECFSNLQRTALKGAEAFVAIIDFNENDEQALTDLITKLYTWGAALLSLSSHPKPAQPALPETKPGTADGSKPMPSDKPGIATGYTRLSSMASRSL